MDDWYEHPHKERLSHLKQASCLRPELFVFTGIKGAETSNNRAYSPTVLHQRYSKDFLQYKALKLQTMIISAQVCAQVLQKLIPTTENDCWKAIKMSC